MQEINSKIKIFLTICSLIIILLLLIDDYLNFEFTTNLLQIMTYIYSGACCVLLLSMSDFSVKPKKANVKQRHLSKNNKMISHNEALERVKNFIQPESNQDIVVIENRYCRVAWNQRLKMIFCEDKKIENERKKRCTARNFDTISAQECFDVFCETFSETTTYENVRTPLTILAIIRDEVSMIDNVKTITSNDTYISEKIEINSATAEQLAKLPSITIIKAKQIIQKRDLSGGFKSVEDFFNDMKFSDNTKKLLNEKVYVSEYEKIETTNDNVERVVDFDE